VKWIVFLLRECVSGQRRRRILKGGGTKSSKRKRSRKILRVPFIGKCLIWTPNWVYICYREDNLIVIEQMLQLAELESLELCGMGNTTDIINCCVDAAFICNQCSHAKCCQKRRRSASYVQQEVKVIWQKAPHGGTIPRLGVTPGGRKLYHWIPGVGFPISVP